MHACPHCGTKFKLRDIPHQGPFSGARTCPDCGGTFTVDIDTKYRQFMFLLVALISLLFTTLLYFHGNEWLVPSLASYFAFALIIYWGNRQLFLVPFKKKKNRMKKTPNKAL